MGVLLSVATDATIVHDVTNANVTDNPTNQTIAEDLDSDNKKQEQEQLFQQQAINKQPERSSNFLNCGCLGGDCCPTNGDPPCICCCCCEESCDCICGDCGCDCDCGSCDCNCDCGSCDF